MATGSVSFADNKMNCDETSYSSEENSESCDDSIADKDYQPSDDGQNWNNSDVSFCLHFCGMSRSCKINLYVVLCGLSSYCDLFSV